MAKGRDKNYVSLWFWLLSMLVLAIPLVNIVMTLVWAFAGENESRKNYFKAVLVVFCLVVGFSFFLLSIGSLPIVAEKLGIQAKP